MRERTCVPQSRMPGWIYRFLLRGNRHHSHHLQAAWNKYGEASFVFELLAVVDCDNEFELRDVENDYLKRDAEKLYNAAPEARSVLNIERSAAVASPGSTPLDR
jgi:hypothetical protein